MGSVKTSSAPSDSDARKPDAERRARPRGRRPVAARAVTVCSGDGRTWEREDAVLEEVGLAVVVNGRSYAVMMVTPGDREDFVYGFLFGEGLIEGSEDVLAWEIVEGTGGHAVYVQLAPEAARRAEAKGRAVIGGSGCGLCGVPDFSALLVPEALRVEGEVLAWGAIQAALDRMQASQWLNRTTGTAHAAILAGPRGTLAREDIGRHNAVDKTVGAALRTQWAAGDARILAVSSRLSFEIVQKALRFRVPVIAAISGVSSLAVRVAAERGITLIGYAREGRMSVYTHKERVALAD